MRLLCLISHVLFVQHAAAHSPSEMPSLLLDRSEVTELAAGYAAKHKYDAPRSSLPCPCDSPYDPPFPYVLPSLNADQKAVLLGMAASLPALDDPASMEYACVSLVHGVFGSGKSFLIAVILCFLHDIFDRSDARRTMVRSG